MRNPSTLLLTGASSGIGAALATAFAAPGRFLALTGRDLGRLEQVAADCRTRGAVVTTQVLDIRDRDATAAWVADTAAGRRLDLVIANAGISAGTAGGREDAAQARAVFETNVAGVLNTVLPAIDVMRSQQGADGAGRRGQIALMSSLAGFLGYAGAPAYSGSKAAVRVYGAALRGALAADGIGVTVICPGFVRSPMTAVNRYPMPLLMDADRAAGLILTRLSRNPATIAFPAPLAWAARLAGMLPAGTVARLSARLPRKPSLEGGAGGGPNGH